MMMMIKSFSNCLIQLVISCTSFTDQLAFFGRSAAIFWTKALSLEHESHQYFLLDTVPAETMVKFFLVSHVFLTLIYNQKISSYFPFRVGGRLKTSTSDRCDEVFVC